MSVRERIALVGAGVNRVDCGEGSVPATFLILDNLLVHHSKPMKNWGGVHAEQIELFYLPSDSPELNSLGDVLMTRL